MTNDVGRLFNVFTYYVYIIFWQYDFKFFDYFLNWLVYFLIIES